MKLNKYEVQLLAALVYQLPIWQAEHGQHADTIKIDYDADEGYLIETAEPKGKRKRTSKFTGEIMAWVESQLIHLGYERVRVKTLILNHENAQFEISLTHEIATEEVTIHDDSDDDSQDDAHQENQAALAQAAENQAHGDDDSVDIEE